MGKTVLKSVNTPKTWRIPRKKNTFITRPNAGSHGFEYGMSIDTFMKYYFELADNSREVRYMINNKSILRNGIAVKDRKEQIGLFDVISFPALKEDYRVSLTEARKLTLVEIPTKEADNLIMKLVSKKVLKKDTVQLNFEFGRNLIVTEKEAKKYTTKGSVVYSASKKKITNFFAFEEKNTCFVIAGAHSGKVVTIESFKDENALVKTDEGEVLVNKKFLVVVGKAKAEVTL